MATQLSFKLTNSSANPPPAASDSFQLTAASSTDIWRSPVRGVDDFNSPILYKTFALSSFQRARVTVSAAWSQEYDQGGLILVLPQTDGTKKGIKSGIELYNGEVFIGTAAADVGADWSLAQTGLRGNVVTIEFQRVRGALWIYVVDGKKLLPIREVSWALSGGGGECWMGAYAARPSKEESEEGLVVDFKNFELDVV